MPYANIHTIYPITTVSMLLLFFSISLSFSIPHLFCFLSVHFFFLLIFLLFTLCVSLIFVLFCFVWIKICTLNAYNKTNWQQGAIATRKSAITNDVSLSFSGYLLVWPHKKCWHTMKSVSAVWHQSKIPVGEIEDAHHFYTYSWSAPSAQPHKRNIHIFAKWPQQITNNNNNNGNKWNWQSTNAHGKKKFTLSEIKYD